MLARSEATPHSVSGKIRVVEQEEYGELLQSLRTRTRERGRRGLDQSLLESRLIDVHNNRDRVVEYLSGIRDDLALGSEASVRESMERFRNASTNTIDGIVVDVTESDSSAYGTSEVDLSGNPFLDNVVSAIDGLIRAINEDDDA